MWSWLQTCFSCCLTHLHIFDRECYSKKDENAEPLPALVVVERWPRGFEHQPLLAINTNHWKAPELSHWNKGIGNRRLMGCQLCRHDKPSKNPDAFSQKWIETSAGTHGKSARSHTWKTEQGSTGKHSLSSLYVNRNGIVKEAAKYLLERRREKSTSFLGCTCRF